MSETIRYRVYHDGKVLGPLAADELKNQPWYHSGVLVCAENLTGINAADWKKVEEILDLIPKSSISPSQSSANENPSHRAPLATRVVNIEELANNVANKQLALEQKLQEELSKTNQIINKSLTEIYAQLSKQTGQIEKLIKSSDEAIASLGSAQQRLSACENTTPEIPKLKSAIENLRHELSTNLEELRWERKKLEAQTSSNVAAASPALPPAPLPGAPKSSPQLPNPPSPAAAIKSAIIEPPTTPKSPPPNPPALKEPADKPGKTAAIEPEKTMPFVFLNKETPKTPIKEPSAQTSINNKPAIQNKPKSKKLIFAGLALAVIALAMAAIFMQPKQKKAAKKSQATSSSANPFKSPEEADIETTKAQRKTEDKTALATLEESMNAPLSEPAAESPKTVEKSTTEPAQSATSTTTQEKPKAAKKQAKSSASSQSASAKKTSKPAASSKKSSTESSSAPALPGVLPGMSEPTPSGQDSKTQNVSADDPAPAIETPAESQEKTEESTNYFE